nr:hypothetical protein [Tanacetum cinerariifolium]
MGRDTVQLETAVNTISPEYLLEFTSEYGISKTLHPELPGPEDRIVDFPEGKVGVTNCRPLTPNMDLFNLIRAPNPTKVKTGSRPRAPHEVPLLTLTATCVIEMDELAAVIDSSSVPSTIDRSLLDFAHEAGASDQGTAAQEMPPDHADPRPSESSHGGKSLAALQLGLASTVVVPEDAPAGVSDPDPLSFADAPSRHPVDVAQFSHGIAAVGDPESENASSAAEVGSPESVYRPELAVTNGGNGITAALEIRAGGKAAEEVRGSGGSPGLKNSGPGARNKKPRSITEGRGECEEGRRRQKCWAKPRIGKYACLVLGSSELRQAFADAVSVRIAKGLSEGLRHGLEHGQAQLSLESIEAYDPEAEAKFVAALQALKDLKYPLVDQLESLKDASIDVIMAVLYLESDTGDDASQDIRDLHPSSSQLTIPVYPEVRDPRNPWACKEEIVLADAIAANISRAEKKKKCRIVCRTHGVGSAHHARSDGVPVSVPMVVPQGLALLLADAATQTEFNI